jgi:predicted RNase H-like HicB family nuclease
MEKRRFTVIIEQDEDGMYLALVPALPGCHTQANNLNDLDSRIKEAIKLCLEKQDIDDDKNISFVGIHVVELCL